MKSKAIIATIILLIISVFVGVVGAQDGSDNPPPANGLENIEPIRGMFGELVRVTTDTTGLSVEEIAQQIRDGATLGEIITNNGGDTETVIASVLETVSSRLQEQVDAGTITQALADDLTASSEQLLRDWMNNAAPIPRIVPSNARPIAHQIETGIFAEFVRVVTDTTGLTVQEIVGQMQDGSTLADVITANGGDVDIVTQTVMDSLSTKLQEQVDAGNITSEQMTSALDAAQQRLTDWMNGDAPFPCLDNRPTPIRDRIGQGVLGEFVRVVTDTTGLTMQEIRQQVQEGSSLADVITANGGDVDTVTQTVMDSLSTKLQEQVDAGNIMSEQMTSALDAAQQRLTDWMNGDAPFPRLARNGR